MDDKKTRKMMEILDNMLQITQRNGNVQYRASHNAEYLVDENGHVNERARQLLIKNIEEMKSILQKDDRKRKSGGILSGFWQSSSIKTVQLYVPVQIATESTKFFSQFLIKELKEISVSSQIVEKSNAKAGLPLLLVCPLSSRTEPSIDHALEGFVWEKPFIVIIVNHGAEENLPEIATSKKLPLKHSYQNITFIDMAFNKDEKLFDCCMNNEAMCSIKDFVDKFK